MKIIVYLADESIEANANADAIVARGDARYAAFRALRFRDARAVRIFTRLLARLRVSRLTTLPSRSAASLGASHRDTCTQGLSIKISCDDAKMRASIRRAHLKLWQISHGAMRFFYLRFWRDFFSR